MAINIERIKALRDLLMNTHEEDINMEHWFKPKDISDDFDLPTTVQDVRTVGWPCGTTACIAGHCVSNLMTAEEVMESNPNDAISNVAAEYLGLNFREKWTLFYAEYHDEDGSHQVELDTITKDEIIKALNIIIERKKVPENLFYLIREGKI